jgi:hypothetical protein
MKLFSRWMLLCVFAILGCRDVPTRVGQPSINAKRAGRAAIEQYDTDGDGAVSGAELEKAPSLNAALGLIDTDGDGRITAEEVTARVNKWKEAGAGVLSVRCTVLLDGRPEPDVIVIYEPEKFLGDDILPAIGVTNVFGGATMSISEEDRSTPDFPPGVQLGFYKVRLTYERGISKTLPSQYNTDTVLGQEISYDDPDVANNRVIYSIKSR